MELLVGNAVGGDKNRREKFEKWLEERGILREMQLFFRQKMALMLHDPQTAAMDILEQRKNWPAVTRAVNWLVGEHMLQKGCCFALSVFKSEAPFLEDLPSLDSISDQRPQLVISQLTLENVLAEVGFRRGEQPFLALHADYRANRGSLLECVLVHSKKVLEGWKARTGDYNSETLRKLSDVDAYVNRMRVDREFLRNDSPILHGALKSRLRSDLERFREQERAVIREEERAKIMEQAYWDQRQTDLDLKQRAAAVDNLEKKFRDEMREFERQKESHEKAITEAVRELEISEKTLARKLSEIEELKKRVSAKEKRFEQKQSEAENLVVQMRQEYQRFLNDDRDRAQLLDEVESLKALMNSLYDAVAGLEEENRRLRETVSNKPKQGPLPNASVQTVDEDLSVTDSARGTAEIRHILENVLAARDGDLRRDMKSVQDGLAKLSEAAISQKTEIRSATAVVAKLERKLSDAQSQLDGLRGEYYEATARRRLLEKKMDLTRAVESRLLRLGGGSSELAAADDFATGITSALTKKLACLTSSSSNEESRSSTEDFLKESQRRMREIEDEVRDLDADLTTYRRRLTRGGGADLGFGLFDGGFGALAFRPTRPTPRLQFPEGYELDFSTASSRTRSRVRFHDADDEPDDLSREVDEVGAMGDVPRPGPRRTSTEPLPPSVPPPPHVFACAPPPEKGTSEIRVEGAKQGPAEDRDPPPAKRDEVEPRLPAQPADPQPRKETEPPTVPPGGPKFSLFAMNLDQAWNK